MVRYQLTAHGSALVCPASVPPVHDLKFLFEQVGQDTDEVMAADMPFVPMPHGFDIQGIFDFANTTWEFLSVPKRTRRCSVTAPCNR